MKDFPSNKKGFTLIELLIAVTIIAILTAVGMANFRTAAKKARDSRRMSELEQIRSALELYRSDAKTYPSAALFNNLSCGDPLDFGTNEYIKSIPCDPEDKTNGNYYYFSDSAFSYELGALLELPPENNDNDCVSNTDTTVVNYCVTNP